MNTVKFNKQNRFSFDEQEDRTTKGRKLNKTKKQNKRNIWDDEE